MLEFDNNSSIDGKFEIRGGGIEGGSPNDFYPGGVGCSIPPPMTPPMRFLEEVKMYVFGICVLKPVVEFLTAKAVTPLLKVSEGI